MLESAARGGSERRNDIAMIDGFDYLPYIRPYPDDWMYMALQELREIRQIGGYRFRMHTTELLTGPVMPNAVNSLANTAIFPGQSRDFYIDVRAGSICWGIGVYSELLTANEDWVSGANYEQNGEIEIIDAQTNEPWWRSSQEAGALQNQPFSDRMGFVGTVAQGPTYEPYQMDPGFYPIIGGRQLLGDGQVMVRITNNAFPPDPVTADTGRAFRAQVALYCFEPQPGLGVNRGH
jgi:hypothetical protein